MKQLSTILSFAALLTMKSAYAQPNDLTADIAASRAVATSNVVKTDQAKLAAAAARVDAAWDAYLPKLTLSGRYTRLSPIDQPSIGGGGSLVVTNAPPGTLVGTNALFAAPPLAFPVVLNQYVAQASLLIPLSDYAFRIYQSHQASLSGLEAEKWSGRATTLQIASNGRVAYYNAVRAHGAVQVAKTAVTQTDAHLAVLRARAAVGEATPADVARVNAQHAAAELAVVQSESLVIVTEANLRKLMHVADDAAFALAEDLAAELPKLPGDLKSYRAAALAKRPELKAIDAQIAASEWSTEVVSAAMLPRLDGVANLTYGNPNPRIFPQTSAWNTTWDVGLTLSWSPTEALIASDQKKVSKASTTALKSTRDQLDDAITLEVTTAVTRVREMEAAIVATGAERRAAEIAYAARKAQFDAGTTTSALLIDAEADLTRARLNELNARVDLRIARAELRRATGEA